MYDITKVEDFVNYLYSRLPQVYRVADEDEKQGNKNLYNYLYALTFGGYNNIVNSQYKDGKLVNVGISDFLCLIDPLTCPADIFPYLYECFGLTYFPDIDIEYQRKFLCNIGYMNTIKGTDVEARFITTVLTGMNCGTQYEKVQATGERVLNIYLVAETTQQVADIRTHGKIVERFLDTRLPFYLRPLVMVKIDNKKNVELRNNLSMIEKLAISKGYVLTETI